MFTGPGVARSLNSEAKKLRFVHYRLIWPLCVRGVKRQSQGLEGPCEAQTCLSQPPPSRVWTAAVTFSSVTQRRHGERGVYLAGQTFSPDYSGWPRGLGSYQEEAAVL